jgi:chemotaxis protein methyltransferase CheR
MLTRSIDRRGQDWSEVDAGRPMEAGEFEQIRQLARSAFGLELKSGKEEMVAARLRRLLREGGFRSYRDYHRHVLGDSTGQALAALIDALATNHTAFLREPSHFDFFREQIMPSLAQRDRVEVWCAACSTGEEVWTLAFLLNDALAASRIQLSATDISNKALRVAQQGTYPVDRCAGLPANWLKRYFTAEGSPPEKYRVSAAVRQQVNFRRANLLERASRRLFPAIFCRNVMIYFDRETQERAVGCLTECLEPGGYLFVGQAESLTRISHGLEYVRPAIYRKPGKREGQWTKSW